MSRNVKTVPKPDRKRATKAAGTRSAAAPKAASAAVMSSCAPCAAKPGTAPAKTADARPRRTVSAEERRRMIAEAAYFIAEREKFQADPAWCWFEAEREIDRKVAAK